MRASQGGTGSGDGQPVSTSNTAAAVTPSPVVVTQPEEQEGQTPVQPRVIINLQNENNSVIRSLPIRKPVTNRPIYQGTTVNGNRGQRNRLRPADRSFTDEAAQQVVGAFKDKCKFKQSSAECRCVKTTIGDIGAQALIKAIVDWWEGLSAVEEEFRLWEMLRASFYRKETNPNAKDAQLLASERVIVRVNYWEIGVDENGELDVAVGVKPDGGGEAAPVISVCHRVLLSFLARLHPHNRKADTVLRGLEYTANDWMRGGAAMREQHQILHLLATNKIRRKLDKAWCNRLEEGKEPNTKLLDVPGWNETLLFWDAKYPDGGYCGPLGLYGSREEKQESNKKKKQQGNENDGTQDAEEEKKQVLGDALSSRYMKWGTKNALLCHPMSVYAGKKLVPRRAYLEEELRDAGIEGRLARIAVYNGIRLPIRNIYNKPVQPGVFWQIRGRVAEEERKEHEKETEGPISLYQAARREGESVFRNEEAWVKDRLNSERGNATHPGVVWLQGTTARVVIGVGVFTWKVKRKFEGPYSEWWLLHNNPSCENPYGAKTVIAKYGVLLKKYSINAYNDLKAEAEEDSGTEEMVSRYVVPDRFSQFGGYAVLLVRLGDRPEDGLAGREVPQPFHERELKDTSARHRLCTLQDCQRIIEGRETGRIKSGQWMYIALRLPDEEVVASLIPGYTPAYNIKGHFPNHEYRKKDGTLGGFGIDGSKRAYRQLLLTLAGGISDVSYWDFELWKGLPYFQALFPENFLGNRDQILYEGYRMLRCAILNCPGQTMLQFTLMFHRMRVCIDENTLFWENWKKNAKPDKKHKGGRGNRNEDNWKDGIRVRKREQVGALCETKRERDLRYKMTKLQKLLRIWEVMEGVNGVVACFPPEVTAFLEDFAAALPNGGMGVTGNCENPLFRKEYRGSNMVEVLANADSVENLRKLRKSRGVQQAAGQFDECIRMVTKLALDKIDKNQDAFDQMDKMGIMLDPDPGAEGCLYEGELACVFSHLVSCQHWVQPAHIDYPIDVLREHNPLMAFFPMTKHGMHLQLWTSPNSRGRLIHIPLGSLVVVPGDTVHSGGFSTGPDGDIRGHCYIYPGKKVNPKPQGSQFVMECSWTTAQDGKKLGCYRPSELLSKKGVGVRKRHEWAEDEYAGSLRKKKSEWSNWDHRSFKAAREKMADEARRSQTALPEEVKFLEKTGTTCRLPTGWTRRNIDDFTVVEGEEEALFDENNRPLARRGDFRHDKERCELDPAEGNISMSFFGPLYHTDGTVNGPGRNSQRRDATFDMVLKRRARKHYRAQNPGAGKRAQDYISNVYSGGALKEFGGFEITDKGIKEDSDNEYETPEEEESDGECETPEEEESHDECETPEEEESHDE